MKQQLCHNCTWYDVAHWVFVTLNILLPFWLTWNVIKYWDECDGYNLKYSLLLVAVPLLVGTVLKNFVYSMGPTDGLVVLIKLFTAGWHSSTCTDKMLTLVDMPLIAGVLWTSIEVLPDMKDADNPSDCDEGLFREGYIVAFAGLTVLFVSTIVGVMQWYKSKQQKAPITSISIV